MRRLSSRNNTCFTDKETVNLLKQSAKNEKQEYSQLKGLRWTLLTNGEKLSESTAEHLQSILQDHHDLAVCYAMKEEMCRLYTLTDYAQTLDRVITGFRVIFSFNLLPPTY